MDELSWGLRVARSDDRDFLFHLNEATMREYVERVWGWDEAEQAIFFERRFEPAGRSFSPAAKTSGYSSLRS
jgi:hypothetical protein